MFTAGSGAESAGRAGAEGAGGAGSDGRAPGATRARTALFRWKGIIPIALVGVVVIGGWMLFGARAIRRVVTEQGSRLVGSQVDVAGLSLHLIAPSVDVRGFAVADPGDLMRDRIAIGRVRIELELLPLLQKKVVVKRVTVADVRTGSARAVRARPVPVDTGPGVVDQARDFAQKVKVPVMSFLPIDSLKAVVLNPEDLKAVQAAVALGRQADSVKQALDAGYASLNLQPVLDSSAAVFTRLQSVNLRTLGLDGARRALADTRRTAAQVDSARTRLERLASGAKRGANTLETLARAINEARKDDYAMARGLLKLPSVDATDIGAALFGAATVERFQAPLRYAALARQYAPPGLMPREAPGPTRRRRAGTTMHFVKPVSYPRFLLRRVEFNIAGADGTGIDYAFAASDVTTDPAIVGRPTLFVARRNARARPGDSLRISGSLDHTRPVPRDVVTAYIGAVRLPGFPIPMLPYEVDAGTGVAAMRFVLDGDRLSGTWSIRSSSVTWRPDSARARPLNTMESLVARALTGIAELDMTAEVGGTLAAPTLAVRSNLDRVVAERVRAVAGEQIAAAQARVRAQVDKLVDEKSEPVRAKVAALRAEADQKVADARAKLEAEKKRLEERIRTLSGGLNLPRLPGPTGRLKPRHAGAA